MNVLSLNSVVNASVGIHGACDAARVLRVRKWLTQFCVWPESWM